MTQTVGAVSAYTTKLLKLLDRVEYRRIDNLEDMEDVARLRRKAYIEADILPVEGDMLIDELDFDPQAYVFWRLFRRASGQHGSYSPRHTGASGKLLGQDIPRCRQRGFSMPE